MAHRSWLRNWSEYLALRGAASLLQCFTVEQNFHTAGGVGSLYCSFGAERRRRAERNIALSFPEWPAERVSAVAEGSMRHMFQLFMVDSLAMPRLVTVSAWPQYVRMGDVGGLLERLVRGERMILLTGHCGNWELLGHFLALIGYPVAALARPLDNPLINRWLLGLREATGTRIITKWGATPLIQRMLTARPDDPDGRAPNGESAGFGSDGMPRGRVGFIADQNAGEGGLFVPFFGRLASSYKSIGLLAMRTQTPIIAGCGLRIGPGFQYELSATDIIEPADWADQPDPLYYITARYNRAMEVMIRRAPEQYLWVHRRWKSRPRFEREGTPPPRRLIEKIEALPWMTQTELDRIIAFSSGSGRHAAQA